MTRLALLALFVNATAVVLHEGGDNGCYYEKDPGTETGGAKGRSYRGLVSNAQSGHVCWNWISAQNVIKAGSLELVQENEGDGKTDTSLSFTPDVEKEDGSMAWGDGLGNHNYCRNPDSGLPKPWCYIKEGGKIAKKACNIDPCEKKQDYVAMAKALTKTMMSTESTGNCMCAEKFRNAAKVRKAMKSKLTVEDLDLEGSYTAKESLDFAGPSLDFLQKERIMGQTKDGTPCFCKR